VTLCTHGRFVGQCQFGCRFEHLPCGCHRIIEGTPPPEWVAAQERRPWWRKLLGIEAAPSPVAQTTNEVPTATNLVVPVAPEEEK
jgi:hypothetical protein